MSFLTNYLKKKILYKITLILGSFNITLINYDIHPLTNEVLDSLSSHYFLLHILQPSRVTTNSKTLIDNIFCNICNIFFVPNMISGNLAASIDYLQIIFHNFL